MPTLSARFSSPSTLRSIRPDLLLAWLRPSTGYLEDRGFRLPEVNSHLTPTLSPKGGEGEGNGAVAHCDDIHAECKGGLRRASVRDFQSFRVTGKCPHFLNKIVGP